MSTAIYAAQRARFVDDSIATASPARLLTMLYDRLVLDLVRAETAQESGDRAAASKQLLHAQEIVLELVSSLRHDEWDGAAGLASIYSFLHSELVRANMTGDAVCTRACRLLVEPLAEAWRAAALDTAALTALADRSS
jgi:flagellar secretion chaperone FliS